MSTYYDRQGNRIEPAEAMALWTQDQRVALTVIDDTCDVSTVWLGLDHNWRGGPPLIFETMVFGGPHSDWQDRYSTEADAIAGHERVVANLQAGLAPDAETVTA